MNIKFLNTVLAAIVLFSSSVASAGILTVGDIVSDASGENWEYVGLYEMATGPRFNDANEDGTFGDYAPIYTGISAAEANFGVLGVNEYYAISTVETVVNHRAWYDRLGATYEDKDENFLADVNNDDLYSQFGDYSAWVEDHAAFDPVEAAAIFALTGVVLEQDNRTNFVFKSVNVPEPSTVAIFSLALLGFGRRFLKK